LPALIDFLLLIDKELPFEDFFAEHGMELFNIIFKLTFYQSEYAVINTINHNKQEEEQIGQV
jgi:hypothetical protein